ncbi:MAG TPA: helix-turn-helix domain-containing protein [Candidatus Limnocylindrales bacterium]
MNDAQVGSVLRAVRIRRGMTQSTVAEAAGVSRAVVWLVERGGFEGTSLRLIRRVSGVLGVSVEFEPRWRGAELAALLDERHAGMVRTVVVRLTAAGWHALPEHTFNVWGERGSIDVLAWHPIHRALLNVEVKSRLADLQDVLSKIDRKRRLAPTLARELGWKPLSSGTLLVLPDETWARNAVTRFGPVFAAALPIRTGGVRQWMKRPDGEIRGIWFLVNDAPGSTKRRRGGSMRVRPRRPAAPSPTPRSNPVVLGDQPQPQTPPSEGRRP